MITTAQDSMRLISNAGSTSFSGPVLDIEIPSDTSSIFLVAAKLMNEVDIQF